MWNGFDILKFRDTNTWKLQDDVVILALDFGHGQCSICNVDKGGVSSQNKDLVFDNENLIIPTAIRYEGRNITIGRQAAGKEGCIYYFKDSPRYFDDNVCGKTKKKLMQDFLGELIKLVIENNRGYFTGTEEKMLLLVGCPSSEEEWMSQKKAYADMIQEAVKKYVPEIGVVILPESRAAFINIAQNRSLYMNKGILVLDFGSSTADATWMQTGKKPIEKSCRLGASEIERIMLEKVLKDSGYDLSYLSLEQKLYYKWVFRRIKELFYNHEMIDTSVIQIYDTDSMGNALEIINPKTGKKVKKLKENINVNVDEEFMEKVVGNFTDAGLGEEAEKFALRNSGDIDSWAGHCQKFIREIIQEMKSAKCECQAVILTGGASKMGFIRDICQRELDKAYGQGRVQVERSDEPSLSVSRGLAMAAINDMNAEAVRESLKNALKPRIEMELRAFSDAAAEKIAKIYYKEAINVMERWADSEKTPEGKRNTAYLGGQIRFSYQKKVNEAVIERILTESYRETIGKCRENIQEEVNKRLEKIYCNRLDEDSYQLNEAEWQSLIAQCNPGKLCSPAMPDLFNLNAFQTAFAVIVLLPLMLVDSVFDTGLSERISDYIDERELSSRKRKKMQRKAEKNYLGKLKANIQPEISRSIEAARQKGDFNLEELIADALEQAFDRIAFYG